jgi:hypothetical protein
MLYSLPGLWSSPHCVFLRSIAAIENWQPILRVGVCRLRACKLLSGWFKGGGGPQPSQLYWILLRTVLCILVDHPMRKA